MELKVGTPEQVEPQALNIPVVINRDLELKRITEILTELRELRNTHDDGYRTFYNSVCDRLDVLESKLIHGL